MENEKKYFYVDGGSGEVAGPCSLEELQRLQYWGKFEERLSEDTMVAEEGTEDWMPFSEIGRLATAAEERAKKEREVAAQKLAAEQEWAAQRLAAEQEAATKKAAEEKAAAKKAAAEKAAAANDLKVGKEASGVAELLKVLIVINVIVGVIMLWIEAYRFMGIALLNGAILMKICERMLIYLQAIAYNTQQLRLEK